MHRHFPAKTQAADSASVQICRLRTRKLANEGCFGTIDRWRIPDSVRARPAARHITSHLQKPASASCADSKAMASSAIGRAHLVSSSLVVGPGRPRLVRTREEHYFSELFSPASCPATHTREGLSVSWRLGGFREILRWATCMRVIDLLGQKNITHALITS